MIKRSLLNRFGLAVDGRVAVNEPRLRWLVVGSTALPPEQRLIDCAALTRWVFMTTLGLNGRVNVQTEK